MIHHLAAQLLSATLRYSSSRLNTIITIKFMTVPLPHGWQTYIKSGSSIRNSFGTVLIFLPSIGFGTEALVPAVPWYWFWFLLFDTRVSLRGFQGVIFYLFW